MGVGRGVAARLPQAAATGGTSSPPPPADRACCPRPWSGVQLLRGDTPGPSSLAVYVTIPQAYSTRSAEQASAGNGAPTWPFTWRQRMSRTGGPGERQKKGLLFDKVSARPATTIGFGRTRPLKLPTPTHWPPSLVVKRAELLLLPMVKEASVTLPMLKLFTVRPATEKFAGTPFAVVRSTSMLPLDSLSDMTKLGGFDAHSYTRRPP